MSFRTWLESLKSTCGLASRRQALGQQPRRHPATRCRLQLKALEDRCLLSTFTVINTNDSGGGWFRAAITRVNADTQPGVDTINFAIGSGAQRISVRVYALPTITHAVVIDGTSQPGFAGTPLIELNGSKTPLGGNGLYLSAGNSTVKDLVINRFGGYGIFLVHGGGDTIVGNYIGTDVTGEVALGNREGGVVIWNGAGGHTIGGTTAATRNLISGNGRASEPVGWGPRGGECPREHRRWKLHRHRRHRHPGPREPRPRRERRERHGQHHRRDDLRAHNLISGNGQGNGQVVYPAGSLSGVVVTGGSGNIVEGNYIGTDVTGSQGLGNHDAGVYVNTNAYGGGGTGNTIGGTVPGAGNLIAYNGADGVRINAGTGDAIQQNFIFANGGLGIDLLGSANKSQAAPALTSAVGSNGSTAVGGTMTSAANTTYTLEFFSNPSGTGQGKTFLGSVTVTTDARGTAAFTSTFAVTLAPGQVVTATATDPFGDTSEFSSGIAVT